MQRLNQSLEAGQAYEGQQVIKTVFHRFRSRKRLLDSYRLLEEGAVAQLQHNQVRQLCNLCIACIWRSSWF